MGSLRSILSHNLILLSFLLWAQFQTGCTLSSKPSLPRSSLSINIPPLATLNSTSTQQASAARGPISVTGFNCLGVHVTGPQITRWPEPQNHPAMGDCVPGGMPQPGILSDLVPMKTGGVVTLSLTQGPARLIQLFAVKSSIGCQGIDAILTGGTYLSSMGNPIEVARATVDLYGDVNLNMSSTGNESAGRPLFCDSAPPFADPTHSSISATETLANGVAESVVMIYLKDDLGMPIAGVVPTFQGYDWDSTNVYGPCSPSDSSGLSLCTLTSLKAENKVLWITSPLFSSGWVYTYVNFIAAPFSQFDVNLATALTSGTCTQGYFYLKDPNGNYSNAATLTTVELDSILGTAPDAGRFYTDGSCSTVVSSVDVAAGSYYQYFYYRNDTIGTASIQVSTSGLSSKKVPLTIGAKLAITSQTTVTAGVCTGAITVSTQNGSGAVYNVPADLTLSLSNGSGSLYPDASCAQSAISQAIISQGTHATVFFFKSTTAGASYIYASDGQNTPYPSIYFPITVDPDVALKLGFLYNTPAGPYKSGTALSGVYVAIQDQFNNTVTSASATVSLTLGNPNSATLTNLDNTIDTGITAGGIATFSKQSIDIPGGTYTLTASVTGNTLTAVTSGNFNVVGRNLEVPIELIDYPLASIDAGTASDRTFSRTSTQIDQTDFDGVVNYGFEVIAKNTDAFSQTVKLIDSSATPQVISTATVPANTTNYTRVFSGPISNSATWTNPLRVNLSATTSIDQLVVTQARVLVRQLNATKTATYFPLASGLATQSNSTDGDSSGTGAVAITSGTTAGQGANSLRFPNFRNPDVTGYGPAGSESWVLETVLGNSNASVVNSIAELYGADGSAMAGSQATCSNCGTAPKLTRSADIAQVSYPSPHVFSSAQDFEVKFRSSTADDAHLYKAGLWHKIINFTQVEVAYRLSLANAYTLNSATVAAEETGRIFLNLSSLFASPTSFTTSLETTAAVSGYPVQALMLDAGTVDFAGTFNPVSYPSTIAIGAKQRVSNSVYSITDQNRFIFGAQWTDSTSAALSTAGSIVKVNVY